MNQPTVTDPPAGLPVLDVDPFSEELLRDPYPYHAQLRAAGPVVWIPKYGIYAAGQHETVRALFADHESFISSAGVGLANFNQEEPFRPKSLILEVDPPDHTRARTILSRILSPRTVTQIRSAFSEQAEALLDGILASTRSDDVVDGVRCIAEAYPLKVFPDAVGLESQGREHLLLYGDMIFNSFGPRNELLARSTEKMQSVTAWIMSHCRRDMLKPGGFGDQIYQAADAGEISQQEAPMLVRSFLSAGVDTTVNGIGNALWCLATHPEEYGKLHADPGLARAAFEESLRYESAVQTFFRTTSRAVELSGVPIPAGSKVLAVLGAANRDERQWPQAERFDIQRRPSGHMAFGSGIHGCVGQVVARLEGELILGALAKRFKRIEIAGKPTRRLNNTLRALGSLPLKLTPS